MTHAWYGHLKNLKSSPLWIAIFISWSIALLEYALQVPANRIGDANHMTLPQLKITQEVIALTVFVPYSILYMKRAITIDFLYASVCIFGAAFFIFRGQAGSN